MVKNIRPTGNVTLYNIEKVRFLPPKIISRITLGVALRSIANERLITTDFYAGLIPFPPFFIFVMALLTGSLLCSMPTMQFCIEETSICG